MPQGSDPRRWPDQQSPDPGSSTQPGWWVSLWEERLPREKTSVGPRLSAAWLVRQWGGRTLMALVPILVVAAVVLGSFGYSLLGEVIAGVILLILAAAVLVPMVERARGNRHSGWH